MSQSKCDLCDNRAQYVVVSDHPVAEATDDPDDPTIYGIPDDEWQLERYRKICHVSATSDHSFGVPFEHEERRCFSCAKKDWGRYFDDDRGVDVPFGEDNTSRTPGPCSSCGVETLSSCHPDQCHDCYEEPRYQREASR